MPLIVLSNNLTPSYLLYLSYFVPTGTAFVTFCESNAKALSTGYALSKVPLRPAGGIATLTLANRFACSSAHSIHAKAHLNQARNNAKSIYFATLQYSSPQNLYNLHCCVLPFIPALPCPIPNTKNCLFSSPECQTPFLHFPMSSLKFLSRPPYQKSHCSELHQ